MTVPLTDEELAALDEVLTVRFGDIVDAIPRLLDEVRASRSARAAASVAPPSPGPGVADVAQVMAYGASLCAPVAPLVVTEAFVEKWADVWAFDYAGMKGQDGAAHIVLQMLADLGITVAKEPTP